MDKKDDKSKLEVMRQYASAIAGAIKPKDIDALQDKLAELPKELQLLLLDLFNLHSLNTNIVHYEGATEDDKDSLRISYEMVGRILNPSSRILFAAKEIPPVNAPAINGVN